MKTFTFAPKAIAALLTLTGSLVFAQTADKAVEIKDAWIRSTVQGQKATGAFMTITAKDGTRLVGVSSPVAGVAEMHEMKIVSDKGSDIMQMRALSLLELPAGKSVALKPGSSHVMLMDLKQPLLAGSAVPLTLRFKDAKGLESKLDLSVPVSTVAPGAAATAGKPDDKAVDHSQHKH